MRLYLFRFDNIHFYARFTSLLRTFTCYKTKLRLARVWTEVRSGWIQYLENRKVMFRIFFNVVQFQQNSFLKKLKIDSPHYNTRSSITIHVYYLQVTTIYINETNSCLNNFETCNVLAVQCIWQRFHRNFVCKLVAS